MVFRHLADLPLNLLKIRCRMFAQGADKVCRQFLSFIDITADSTAPLGLSAGLGFLGLGLDVGLIIAVGGRGHVREHLHVIHPGDEQGMASQINGLLHSGTDIAIGSCGHIVKAVFTSLAGRVLVEFVHGPPGLEAKMPEGVKAGILAENGDIELARSLDQVMGKIRLVDRNADPVGLRGYLTGCIDDTPAVPALMGRSEHKETIG